MIRAIIDITRAEKKETLVFHIPEKWDELGTKQLLSLAMDFFSGKSMIKTKVNFIHRILKKNIHYLSSEQIHYLLIQCDALFSEITLTKHHFQKIKNLYGPGATLDQTTVSEYAKAETHYSAFVKTRNIEELNRFIACIYREKKPFYWLKKLINPEINKDKRVFFDPNEVEKRALKIAKLPLDIRFAICVEFIGIQNLFCKKFKYIFPQKPKNKKEDNSKNKNTKTNWADMKLTLAESQVKLVEQPDCTYIIDAYSFLNKKAKEKKEMDEYYKKLNRKRG